MRTCIVNPSRCGSTLLLHILDKYFRLRKTPRYEMLYEVMDDKIGRELLEKHKNNNFLFKYQYLFTHKPLLGADKYIVIDRKDKDAWVYSSYHAWMNSHAHGKLDPNKKYISDDKTFQIHTENLLNCLPSWEAEKARLISHGAVSLWYEDIKDKTAMEILELCGFPTFESFDKDDLYFNGIKLEKVWSNKNL
jgi:hypothetical protein|tara:strand:- start:1729 stop:2304 length:576 start_codon:yes stop_codon:yes gene_type:complete